MPTHNKHIFVRPTKVCLLWKSAYLRKKCLFEEKRAYFGKWRILHLRYSLRTNKGQITFPKKNYSGRIIWKKNFNQIKYCRFLIFTFYLSVPTKSVIWLCLTFFSFTAGIVQISIDEKLCILKILFKISPILSWYILRKKWPIN